MKLQAAHRTAVLSGRVAFANTSGQAVYVNGNQSSYVEALRHQRLALPFEAASADMRPVFGDLDNTGSRQERPQNQTPQVNFILDW